MHKILILIISLLLFSACDKKREISSTDPVKWNKRTVINPLSGPLKKGSTYLSVYSQIYSQKGHRYHDLIATVSIRNTNRDIAVYIEKAEFFDTKGKSIRSYFDQTIFLAPMETVEIVINGTDLRDRKGASFLFDWKVTRKGNVPLFEAVMISSAGQQGISFSTQGQKLD